MYGLASVSIDATGETLIDRQNDIITPEELTKAFHDFVVESREGDVMHDREAASVLVECFIASNEKLTALFKAFGREGIVPADFQGVGAWVGFRVMNEDVWKRVKSGELGAFSIEGTAERVEVAA